MGENKQKGQQAAQESGKSAKQESAQQRRPIREHIPRALLTLFLLGLVGTWAWLGFLFSGGSTVVQQERSETEDEVVTPLPTVYARQLDGVIVESEPQTHPTPVGVMVENLLGVRPQSGLGSASVVYETLAEGGATRFLAIFPGTDVPLTEVGPVRSARPYYVEWFSEYDGLYAHAGGSPDALEMLSAFADLHNLNGISSDGKYFWRDRSKSAPHNLFTSTELLGRALHDKGLEDRTPSFVPWTFKEDRPLDERPADGQYITVNFSSLTYEVGYTYDRATNTYLRSNARQPHTDALGGGQIRVKNVVVQVIPPIADIGEKGRLTLDVHGEGTAYIFVDGGANIGTWKKADRTGRTQFFYEDGTAVQFDRGNTWVEVLPSDRSVEYGAPAT